MVSVSDTIGKSKSINYEEFKTLGFWFETEAGLT